MGIGSLSMTARGTVSTLPRCRAVSSALAVVLVVLGALLASSAGVVAQTRVFLGPSATTLVGSIQLEQWASSGNIMPVLGSGGTAPLTYSMASPLPSGLSLSSTTGVIEGTPDTPSANAPYEVVVRDANNNIASSGFMLEVVAIPKATAVITSRTLKRDEAASFTPVTATGGIAPLIYHIAPSLPFGLDFSTTTGAITGTPTTTSASTNYVVTVKNSDSRYVPSASQATFTLKVILPMTVATIVPATTGTVGTALDFTPVVQAGGTAPLTYSISSPLPAGLTFSTSTGAVTGTPTTYSVNRSYTVTITDANAQTGSSSFQLGVDSPLVATTVVPVKSLLLNSAATTFTPVTASGGVVPYTYAISPALPAGLSFNSSTGAISGTPTAALAETTHTVTITDSLGVGLDARGGSRIGISRQTASSTFRLSVVASLTATTVVPAKTIARGASASFTPVVGSGGTTPYTFSISPALPAGLSIVASTGAITGTPTASLGETTFTVTITDTSSADRRGRAALTASSTFKLTVNDTLTATTVIPTRTVTKGTATASFVPVVAAGGLTPYTFAISPALPAGLAFDTTTGAVSGTASAVQAETTFTVTVTDASGGVVDRKAARLTASSTFKLTVNDTLTVTTVIPSTTLTKGTAASSFIPVVAAGGRTPYTYSVSPTLPTGLSYNAATGAITGTPSVVLAETTFTVTVTDTTGGASARSGPRLSASDTFKLTVANAAVVTISPTALPAMTVGAAVTQTLTASGGTAPYTFAITGGALPSGLSLAAATGVVSGTPTAGGGYSVTVQATDKNGVVGSRTYTGTVASPSVEFVTTTLVEGKVGKAYTQTIVMRGGQAPYQIQVGSPPGYDTARRVGRVIKPLPPGLAISGMTITGTPTSEGTYEFALLGRDSSPSPGPYTAVRLFTIKVGAGVPAPVDDAATTRQGEPVGIDVTDNDSGGPFTSVQIVRAPRHGKASVAGLVIQYNPDDKYTGQDSFTYRTATSGGVSATATVTVSVAARPDPSKDPQVLGLISAQYAAARRFAETQINNFNGRLESLHGDGYGENRMGITVTSPGDAPSRTLGANGQPLTPGGARPGAAPGTGGTAATSGAGSAPVGMTASQLMDRAFSFWSAGQVMIGSYDVRTNKNRLDFTTGGLSLGADWRMSKTATIGIGVGYGSDRTDVGGKGTTSRGDSYNVILYGGLRPWQSLFVDAVLGYGVVDFESRRAVSGGGFASGSRSGDQVFGSLTAGTEFKSASWLISPYARLSGISGSLDPYRERGAGTNSLAFGSMDYNAVTGALGLRGKLTTVTETGRISPFARIELQQDLSSTISGKVSYADLRRQRYGLTIEGFDQTRAMIGLGAEADVNGFLFMLEYTGTVGTESGTMHSLRGRIGRQF